MRTGAASKAGIATAVSPITYHCRGKTRRLRIGTNRNSKIVTRDGAIAKGRSTAEKKTALLARITPTTSYAGLADCDLVIEAVFEDRAIKADVTRKAEAVLPATSIFGSPVIAFLIAILVAS